MSHPIVLHRLDRMLVTVVETFSDEFPQNAAVSPSASITAVAR